MPIIGLVNIGLNKYGTVQELRSTLSHTKRRYRLVLVIILKFLLPE